MLNIRISGFFCKKCINVLKQVKLTVWVGNLSWIIFRKLILIQCYIRVTVYADQKSVQTAAEDAVIYECE